ncbi:tail assembly chaperone [Microbacterium phage Morrigan]|nr:tail assembly chaperone [Microbacterium phage Morrigan]
MVFSNLEELKAAVEDRRQAVLTLEIDLGGAYSEEHEQAKQDLAKAEGMRMLMQQGGGQFLNGDSLEPLRQRVAETKPETPSVWVQYKKLPLGEWRAITKQANLDQFDQYERVLPQTFIGLYGTDPAPEEKPEDWVAPEPLTTDPRSVSSRGGDELLLPGGSLASVVQNFMVWQNSGGRGHHPPYEIGPRLALLLDMALVSGRSPVRLLDEESPDTWSEIDLEVVSQWKTMKEVRCSGCGRPLSQHLYNSRLGREETVEDYTPWSLECPAQQAIANGQSQWRQANKSAIEAHNKGNGPDPAMGVLWLSQGPGEILPQPDEH